MCFLVPFCFAPFVVNFCVHGRARCSPPSSSQAFRFDVTNKALPRRPWDALPCHFPHCPTSSELVCLWLGPLLSTCSPPSRSQAFRFDVTNAALPAMLWDVFPGPFLLRPIRCEFLCSWSGSLLSAFLLPGFPTRCDQQGSATQALGCVSLSLSALPHTFGTCVFVVGPAALHLPLPRLSDLM